MDGWMDGWMISIHYGWMAGYGKYNFHTTGTKNREKNYHLQMIYTETKNKCFSAQVLVAWQNPIWNYQNILKHNYIIIKLSFNFQPTVQKQFLEKNKKGIQLIGWMHHSLSCFKSSQVKSCNVYLQKQTF